MTVNQTVAIGHSPPGGDDLRRFMRHWPTGVLIVTTVYRGVPVGCTVNAMMSVSLAPPLLVVALARTSATLAAIGRTGSFGLNLLAAHQAALSDRFAHTPQHQRFTGVPYLMRGGIPVLRDALTTAVCATHDIMPCGDHLLVVGAPEWLSEGEHRTPLVFHRHGYHRLTPC